MHQFRFEAPRQVRGTKSAMSITPRPTSTRHEKSEISPIIEETMADTAEHQFSQQNDKEISCNEAKTELDSSSPKKYLTDSDLEVIQSLLESFDHRIIKAEFVNFFCKFYLI